MVYIVVNVKLVCFEHCLFVIATVYSYNIVDSKKSQTFLYTMVFV